MSVLAVEYSGIQTCNLYGKEKIGDLAVGCNCDDRMVLVGNPISIGGMSMERWKRQFEYWILFILMLIVAVLSLAGMRNHRIYWLVILVPIGSGFLLMWLYKESRLASIKAFMDHYRIRPVHLWMGAIAVYYLMAVLSDLVF